MQSPPDATVVFADPHSPDLAGRRVLVRLSGFGWNRLRKLDFTLSAAAAPHTFEHYASEFNALFELSAKVVVVEGDSPADSTAILKSAANQLADPALVETIDLISGIDDGLGDRAGVRVSERQDDTRQPISLSASSPIVILNGLDETHLEDASFRKELIAVLDDPARSLFATIGMRRGPLVGDLRTHPRTTVLRAGHDGDAATVEARVLSELGRSLFACRSMAVSAS